MADLPLLNLIGDKPLLMKKEVRIPSMPKTERIFRKPRKQKDKSNIPEPVKRRRYSFSHLHIVEEKITNQRRKSIGSFSTFFSYLPKPVDNSTTLATKSAETFLYESLYRLIMQHMPFVRQISDFIFSQLIGKGGFGQVWLANDLKTGKLVAIKELFAEKLVGKNLVNFVREVVTMAKSHNRFILPFVGFTVDKPYSIITEYMPNSALNIHLFKELNSKVPVFSGTHLTMIAIGIIHAICHLHSIKIVHRDIKAANILLDHHFLPKLCDFGISRICKPRKFMSDHVGTPAYMAPEILNTNNYDFKVDIYSYGMLLFHMIEKRVPFSKVDVNTIFNDTSKGKRPTLTRKNSQSIIDLMNLCWSQNPNGRPSAVKIYQMFASGQVAFEGTDPEVISKFTTMLDNEQEAKKKAGKTNVNFLITKTERQIIMNLENKLRSSIKKDQMKLTLGFPIDEFHFEQDLVLSRNEAEKQPTQEELDKEFQEIKAEIPQIDQKVQLRDVIKNYRDPNFKSTVTEIFNSISPEKFEPVYVELAKIISECNDEDIIIFILAGFHKLIQRNSKFIKTLNRYHFYSLIPVTSDELKKSSLYLIGTVFRVDPSAVGSTMFRALGTLLRSMPRPTLYLFASFIPNYSKCSNPDPVLDFLLNYAREYINTQNGTLFLKITYMLSQIETFYKYRRDEILTIISAYTRSQIPVTCKKAFVAYYHLRKNDDPIPFDAIITRLKSNDCIKECIQLLSTCNNPPQSRLLYKTIGDKCNNPDMALVVLKYATLSKENKSLIAKITKWMNFANSSTLKLFLYLFSHYNLRYYLLHARLFPTFLTKCMTMLPEESSACLGPVLRRANLNQEFINNLADSLFFDALCNALKSAYQAKNSKTIKGVLLILDTCAQAGYAPQFKLFLDMMALFLKTSSELTKPAALIFVTLSSHKKMAGHFKKSPPLVKYFEVLLKNDSMSKPASIFLSNVKNS